MFVCVLGCVWVVGFCVGFAMLFFVVLSCCAVFEYFLLFVVGYFND